MSINSTHSIDITTPIISISKNKIRFICISLLFISLMITLLAISICIVGIYSHLTHIHSFEIDVKINHLLYQLQKLTIESQFMKEKIDYLQRELKATNYILAAIK